MNAVSIKYGREDLTSRIPGLFPYLEYDEYGMCHMHRSMDSESGCYGKFVPFIRIPDGVFLTVGENVLVEEGNTYSYRTLSNYYYKYKDDTDSTFITFFKEGIGYFDISPSDDWDLVPQTEYYANSGRIYEQYRRIKTACDNYLLMRPISGENCQMECLVDRYRRMGGDEMMNFFKSKYDEMVGKSEYFYQLGCLEDTHINIPISIVSDINDLGVRTPYMDYWKPGEEYPQGMVVIYNDRSYVCDVDNAGSVWDTVTEQYVFDEVSFSLIGESDDTVELRGTTDSRLKAFRKTPRYIDIIGHESDTPEGKDWLCFYKVGTIVNYSSVTDEYGNIELNEGSTRTIVVGDTQEGLMAYGDILADITVNSDDRTITFTYVIGANLKGKLTNVENIEGVRDKKRYYYSNFQYNPNDDMHGVVFTETYPYEENGEIDYFYNLDTGLFDYFIAKNDNSAAYQTDMFIYHGQVGTCLALARCEFITEPNLCHTYVMVDGVEVPYSYISSNYIVTAASSSETIDVPTFSEDKYIGITYPPDIDQDVFISRGNAASWERHIKLSEVRSFDDLENYANGGFFNLV